MQPGVSSAKNDAMVGKVKTCLQGKELLCQKPLPSYAVHSFTD